MIYMTVALLVAAVVVIVLTSFFRRKNIKILANSDTKLTGYFSQVPSLTPNPLEFPLFYLARPIKLTVNEGESLFIPKKWWHWVFSHPGTNLSVNVWFTTSRGKFGTVPRVIDKCQEAVQLKKKWTKTYLTSVIDKPIIVWKKPDDSTREMEFGDFIDARKSEGDCLYMITLDHFNEFGKNKHVKEALASDVAPLTNKLVPEGAPFEYNLWFKYCNDTFDTSLHYDDSYGILTVIRGQKTVYLYDPAQTMYLYPNS